jgi:hypothetical protein
MANHKKSVPRKPAARVRKKKSLSKMSFMTHLKGIVARRFRDIQIKGSKKAVQAMAVEPENVGLLIEHYVEVVEKSAKEKRPFSFRVNVDPHGGAVSTFIEQPISPAGGETAENEHDGFELERALAAARDRGRIRAAEILSREDMVNADDFAKLLHTTRMTINSKRQSGLLLGLDGAKRGFRFPIWQLNRDGRPYPELPVLRERLGGPWAVFRFLVQAHDELDGLTGRQALEQGQGEALLAAAESVGRGDFR